MRMPSPGGNLRKARRPALLRRPQGTKARLDHTDQGGLDVLAQPLSGPPGAGTGDGGPRKAFIEKLPVHEDPFPEDCPAGTVFSCGAMAGPREELPEEALHGADLPGEGLQSAGLLDMAPGDGSLWEQEGRDGGSPPGGAALPGEAAGMESGGWPGGGDGQENWDEALEEQRSPDGGRIWIAGGSGGSGQMELELSAAGGRLQLRSFLQNVYNATGFACLPGKKQAAELLRSLGGKTDGAARSHPSRQALLRECAGLARLLKDFTARPASGHPRNAKAERLLKTLEREMPELGSQPDMPGAGACAFGEEGENFSAAGIPSSGTVPPAPRVFSLDPEDGPGSSAGNGVQGAESLAPEAARDGGPAGALRVLLQELADAGSLGGMPGGAKARALLRFLGGEVAEPGVHAPRGWQTMGKASRDRARTDLCLRLRRYMDAGDAGPGLKLAGEALGLLVNSVGSLQRRLLLGPLEDAAGPGGHAAPEEEGGTSAPGPAPGTGPAPVAAGSGRPGASRRAGPEEVLDGMPGDAGESLRAHLQRLSDSRRLVGMPGRKLAARLLRQLGGAPLFSTATAEAGWTAIPAEEQELELRTLCGALQAAADEARQGRSVPGLKAVQALLKVLLDAVPDAASRAKQERADRSSPAAPPGRSGKGPVSGAKSSPASPAMPADPGEAPCERPKAGQIRRGEPAAGAAPEAADPAGVSWESLSLGTLGGGGQVQNASGRAEALLKLAVGAMAQAWSGEGGLPLDAALAAHACRTARTLLDRAFGQGMAKPHARRCWTLVRRAPAWFRREAAALARLRLAAELEELAGTNGAAFAAGRLEECRQAFGEALDGMAAPQARECLEAAGAVPLHTLWTREPEAEWDVYIDESGAHFSGAEAGAADEGRVVAVCLRKGTRLPDIGSFHSTDRGFSAASGRFATLLAGGCGLIGFTRTALGADGPDGWLVSICELVKWVWRLLPLRPSAARTVLRFHVEERSGFVPGLGTDLGRIMLEAELRSENPRRAQQMHIASISFESKKSPMLAWADVAAYLWSRAEAGVYPGFARSGLAGTCFVDCGSETLRACEAMLRQGAPSGEDWTCLVQEKAAPGSLQSLALEWLRQRCLAKPSLWEPYRQAMQDALEAAEPDMDALERMASWLHAMSMPAFAAEFFWNTGETARLAAAGPGSRPAGEWLLDLRDAMAAVEGMLADIRRMHPLAALHGALRLSQADCALFRFGQAALRLGEWNAASGGALPGIPCWDARVLCQLGRCLALQGDPASAQALFREAQELLLPLAGDGAEERIPAAAELLRKARLWLACALLDDPAAEPPRLAAAMAQALGMGTAAASARFGERPLEGPPEEHLLLCRYLALHGGEAERRAYRRFDWRWTMPDAGFGSGGCWVRIQYYRWLAAGDADWTLRRELAASLPRACGKSRSPADELAACAVAKSLDRFGPSSVAEQELLDQAWRRLAACLPGAAAIVRRLQDAAPGDPWLARKALPFDLC